MTNYILDQIKLIKSNCSCNGTIPFCPNCSSSIKLEWDKEKANIPLRWRKADFENIKSPVLQDTKQLITDYLNNIDTNFNFFFYNGNSSVRTIFSCIFLIELLKRGYSCFFTNLSMYIRTILTEDNDRLSLIKESDFIVLDDLGKETKSESGMLQSIFEGLLKERMYQLRPTIITSQKSIEYLNSYFGFDINTVLDQSLKTIKF